MGINLKKSPRLRLYFCIIVIIYIWVRINILLRIVRPFTSRERFREIARKHHTRNAKILYNMILKLQGLFIKVGQFLSMRVDMLPAPYTKELSKLQDQVPPRPFSEIKERIEKELGKIEEIFSEFNPEPIAAASLGQVHRAKLKKNGLSVAVKVQYPGIDRIVETDMKVLKIILRVFGVFRKNLQWKILLQEFQTFISSELDYINEGKNAEKIGEELKNLGFAVVPKVVWEYTTKHVLVLEFIEGIKVTDYTTYESFGIKRDEVMRKVLDIYFYMIFARGFFQADPHPGNIFVLKDRRICLLDFGLAKEVRTETLRGFGRMGMAITNRDPEELARSFMEIGFQAVNGKTEGFRKFAEIVINYAPQVIYRNPKNIRFDEIINAVVELVRKYPLVRIPSDFLLMGRVMGLLLGLGRFLKTKVKVNEIILPYLMEGLKRSGGIKDDAT